METKRVIHEIGKVIVVVEVFIVRDGKVLLQQRSLKRRRFPGYWTGPGGHVDEGEDALTAAIREVKEETAVSINNTDISLKAVAIHHHLDLSEVYLCFVFLASIPSEQEIISHLEEGRAEWVSLGKLKALDKVFPPAQYYFDHVLNDKPGILYTNIQWENSQLVKVTGRRIDKAKC